MKKTYHIYLLKRISVIPYVFIFLALLVAAGFLLHMYVKSNNLSVILFVLFLTLDALLGYFLSIAAATERVEISIDNVTMAISGSGDIQSEEMPLTNIAEYEVNDRTIIPKRILELKLVDQRIMRFFGKLPWASRSGDFEAFVAYIKNLSGQEIRDDLPSM